jgi:hypothetical protein
MEHLDLMDLLDHLEPRASLDTRVHPVWLVFLEREVFLVLLEIREAEEILVFPVLKDLLVKWENVVPRVLQDLLVHLEKLAALEILVKPDLLERWELLV